MVINLKEYHTFKSVDEMEKDFQQHIYNNGIKGATKKVFICIKEYAKINLGACKIKADTISEKSGVSRRTVMRSINRLLELKVIEKVNCTKLNGIKGANIYSILPYNVTSEMAHRDTSKDCRHIKPETANLESEDIISLKKSFKTSNLINIYNCAYAGNEFLNEWQKELLQLMNVLKIDEILGDDLHKVIAATEINDAKEFHIAKEIIVSIAKDLQCGKLSVSKTLRAIYKGAYDKRMERASLLIEPVGPSDERFVPSYNFLEQREFNFKF